MASGVRVRGPGPNESQTFSVTRSRRHRQRIRRPWRALPRPPVPPRPLTRRRVRQALSRSRRRLPRSVPPRARRGTRQAVTHGRRVLVPLPANQRAPQRRSLGGLQVSSSTLVRPAPRCFSTARWLDVRPFCLAMSGQVSIGCSCRCRCIATGEPQWTCPAARAPGSRRRWNKWNRDAQFKRHNADRASLGADDVKVAPHSARCHILNFEF
jgi:hypothetical protein